MPVQRKVWVVFMSFGSSERSNYDDYVPWSQIATMENRKDAVVLCQSLLNDSKIVAVRIVQQLKFEEEEESGQ